MRRCGQSERNGPPLSPKPTILHPKVRPFVLIVFQFSLYFTLFGHIMQMFGISRNEVDMLVLNMSSDYSFWVVR